MLFYVDSDCIEEGFWKHPTSGVCLPCPEGGFCPGGGRVWPIKGYWSFNETLAPGQCVPLVACPGAIGETPGCVGGSGGGWPVESVVCPRCAY